MKIGLPAMHRRDNLIYSNWIPISRILLPDGYEDWRGEMQSMFYAESWALVHYLHHGPNRPDDLGPRMLGYVRSVESGDDSVTAFESAFDISAGELNKRIRDYLERGRFGGFRIELATLLPDFDPEVRKITSTEIALRLGQIALRSGDLEAVKNWFNVAVTDTSVQPWAEAGLGDVLKFRGEFEQALPHFERALELAPSDPLVRLDMAEYWHRRAETGTDSTPEQRNGYLQRARSHYVRAWELDTKLPETYAMYGRTFLGDNYEKAVDMLEEAEYLLPSNLTVRLLLAQAYADAGRSEEAERSANSVLAWSHDESAAAKTASQILEKLEGRENRE